MVNKIGIRNFKSIDTLDLELGRFNVIIGANGSGKSNVLEAIVMGGGAIADRLTKDGLEPRGLRYVDPQHMFAGFEMENGKQVTLIFVVDGSQDTFRITTTSGDYAKWMVEENEFDRILVNLAESIFSDDKSYPKNKEGIPQLLGDEPVEVLGAFDILKTFIKKVPKDVQPVFKNQLLEVMGGIKKNIFQGVTDFLIYSPNFDTLREFSDKGQIEPLSNKGDGLFKLLKTFKKDQIAQLNTQLQLFDWFKSFDLPKGALSMERYLKIKDRYVAEKLKQFDQRSANEGFLFVLFYLALFMSEYTPRFFAIDNIETALNPKLATELMVRLNRLSKEHGKQVIMTTHSPAILDGLDLNDDEQRLFVAYRNVDGRTRLRRVPAPRPLEGDAPVPLSRSYLNGAIGGLAKNI